MINLTNAQQFNFAFNIRGRERVNYESESIPKMKTKSRITKRA